MWTDAYEIIKTKYTKDRKGDATAKAKTEKINDKDGWN